MKILERVALLSVAFASVAIGSHLLFRAPAFAQPAPSQTVVPRIASVDILAVVDKMLASERYHPLRFGKAQEFNAQLEPLQKEYRDAEFGVVSTPESDPTRAEKIEVWRQKRQAFETKRQELDRQFDEFSTSHAVEGYRIAIETAQALARARGYTHVFASRSGTDLQTRLRAGFSIESAGRPLLISPPEDDLTSAVIAELKVETAWNPPEDKKDDHAGHDHSGHDHAGHDHSSEKKPEGAKVPEKKP
ncbi:MAG: OmpH family outer membrane protein [Planctomycetota bacterium]|nr:OmpH family outer membrane protein [Planctomycetota bacterium]